MIFLVCWFFPLKKIFKFGMCSKKTKKHYMWLVKTVNKALGFSIISEVCKVEHYNKVSFYLEAYHYKVKPAIATFFHTADTGLKKKKSVFLNALLYNL